LTISPNHHPVGHDIYTRQKHALESAHDPYAVHIIKMERLDLSSSTHS